MERISQVELKKITMREREKIMGYWTYPLEVAEKTVWVKMRKNESFG